MKRNLAGESLRSTEIHDVFFNLIPQWWVILDSPVVFKKIGVLLLYDIHDPRNIVTAEVQILEVELISEGFSGFNNISPLCNLRENRWNEDPGWNTLLGNLLECDFLFHPFWVRADQGPAELKICQLKVRILSYSKKDTHLPWITCELSNSHF